MKKFIVKIIVYSIPLIFLLIYIEVRISKYFTQSNNFSGEMNVWEDIYNKNANCDIAILGSSTAWVQLNPRIMEETLQAKVYNFGIDGLNFELQYLRFKELLKYNKHPKKIILVSSPLSLEDHNDLYNFAQFLPYMLWNFNIFKHTKSYNGFNYFDYFIPLARYFGKKNLIKKVWHESLGSDIVKKIRSNGFLAKELAWNEDLENAKNIKKNIILYFSPRIIDLLNNFFEDCKDLGIKITLIIPPIYYEGQDYIRNLDEYENIYTHLAAKNNLEIYNYLGHDICKEKNLFYNANHLNKKGSIIFSEFVTSKFLNEN